MGNDVSTVILTIAEFAYTYTPPLELNREPAPAIIPELTFEDDYTTCRYDD